MVCKLAYKLPLRRCECGGKAELCRYIWTPDEKQNGWYIGCPRFACNRMVTKIYKSPIVAIIKWNFKDWRYSKEKLITNSKVKMMFLAKQYNRATKNRKEKTNV